MNRDREGRNWSELKGRPKRQFVEVDENTLYPLFSSDSELLQSVFYGEDIVKHEDKFSHVNQDITAYNMVNIMPSLRVSRSKASEI